MYKLSFVSCTSGCLYSFVGLTGYERDPPLRLATPPNQSERSKPNDLDGDGGLLEPSPLEMKAMLPNQRNTCDPRRLETKGSLRNRSTLPTNHEELVCRQPLAWVGSLEGGRVGRRELQVGIRVVTWRKHQKRSLLRGRLSSFLGSRAASIPSQLHQRMRYNRPSDKRRGGDGDIQTLPVSEVKITRLRSAVERMALHLVFPRPCASPTRLCV